MAINRTISLKRNFSWKNRLSNKATKAGKLAKPSVATATPPTLTAVKKVTQ